MHLPRPLALTGLLVLSTTCLHANGAFRRGSGGSATAVGGAVVAAPTSPLAAMWSNPAALPMFRTPTGELGYFGAYADANFANAVNGTVDIDKHSGHGAEFALAWPISGHRAALAVSLIPETALVGDWSYLDAPGGLDGTVSYGRQRHRSRFVAVRNALGGGWKITDRLSVGGSIGVVYERIDLQVPYIFQNTPGLEGFKTLLDMETDGVSWNGDIGLQLQLRDDLVLGMRYRTSTSITSDGDASGEAGAQLAALGPLPPRTDFNYSAELDLSLPEIYSAGLTWQAKEDLSLMAQVDWIPWGSHFDNMQVVLTSGDNPDLPGTLVDSVPLGWKDRYILRAGVEYELNPCWTLRGGYSYSPSPIPSDNVTPLNAAIPEHSVTLGFGYEGEDWGVDVGYQLDLRKSERVGTSVYDAGEYSDSKVSLLTHWLSVSTTFSF